MNCEPHHPALPRASHPLPADNAAAATLPDNPFCTRRVRPGALAYRFAENDSLAAFCDRWRANGYRGAVLGPHGTGKSTLLALLTAHLASADVPCVAHVLHAGERRLPPKFWRALTEVTSQHARHAAGLPAAAILVDGYEQLSTWQRLCLARTVWRYNLAILVTAHQPVRFPTLMTTRADLAVLRILVDSLQSGFATPLPVDEVHVAFSQHPTNLREALFALYDKFESSKLSSPMRSPECAGRA